MIHVAVTMFGAGRLAAEAAAGALVEDLVVHLDGRVPAVVEVVVEFRAGGVVFGGWGEGVEVPLD